MGKFKDLTGMKFGRLTVIKRAENKGKYTCWKCMCDCGNEVIVTTTHLLSEHTQSCGCFKTEKTIKNLTTHGLRNTKTYNVWTNIKLRCFNSKHKHYKNYGERGITMFAEWVQNFQAFYDYVSKLEHFGESNYTLDRIDVNGNYEPNNLRWATRQTQNRNRRDNITVEHNGKSIVLADVAEQYHINYHTLKTRYQRGDRGDRLFRPVTNSTKS